MAGEIVDVQPGFSAVGLGREHGAQKQNRGQKSQLHSGGFPVCVVTDWASAIGTDELSGRSVDTE
jgi:hypothetical protein